MVDLRRTEVTAAVREQLHRGHPDGRDPIRVVGRGDVALEDGSPLRRRQLRQARFEKRRLARARSADQVHRGHMMLPEQRTGLAREGIVAGEHVTHDLNVHRRSPA